MHRTCRKIPHQKQPFWPIIPCGKRGTCRLERGYWVYRKGVKRRWRCTQKVNSRSLLRLLRGIQTWSRSLYGERVLKVHLFSFSPVVVETECHFTRCLPINNLVEGSYIEVLAYWLWGYAGLTYYHILIVSHFQLESWLHSTNSSRLLKAQPHSDGVERYILPPPRKPRSEEWTSSTLSTHWKQGYPCRSSCHADRPAE